MYITLTNEENVINPITNEVKIATQIKIIGCLISYSSRILRIDFSYNSDSGEKLKTNSITIKENDFDSFVLSEQNLYQAIINSGIPGTIEVV